MSTGVLDPAFEDLLASARQADPSHVGLIMDGNGRWAQARGLSRAAGHEAGLKAFRAILSASADHGVPILTFYGFSAENWGRPEGEIRALADLFIDYLRTCREEFLARDCRFVVTGRREQLSAEMRQLIALAERETAHCRSRLVNFAVSYGGRQEVTDAVRLLAKKVAAGTLAPEDIQSQHIADHLYLGSLPDPDLIIRTSGEHRLSGFLLWQSAYAELIFHDALWPDFTSDIFGTCLARYRARDRRFGQIKLPGQERAQDRAGD